MSEAKEIPGSWTICETRPLGISDADARLIASAPDLLAALKRLLEDTEHAHHDCGDPPDICPVAAARAAIARAEGGST